MASSPFIAGVLGGVSIRSVFIVDLAVMALLGVIVRRTMVDGHGTEDHGRTTDHGRTRDQGPRTREHS